MGTDDTIQIRCSRCLSKFRDKAGRVRGGYSRQCPSCERMLFFEEGSPNKDIHEALRKAELMRKAIRQRQDEEHASRVAESQPADDTEEVRTSASPRRGVDRRTYSSGRSR
jgi:hypothetical protein